MTRLDNLDLSQKELDAYFPIRVLSERTSVGSSTLRAWERRYGLLTPVRTPKGHRLYNDADVKLVLHVLTLLEEGHSLPSIAKQVKQGLVSVEALSAEEQLSGVWAGLVANNLQAISDYSTERVEAIYNDASSIYPVDMVTERLIEPTLRSLGEKWQDRELGISEEHFYTGWVRNRLGARFHHAYSQASGARILLACVPGSYHELGLMLFAISALTRGYRVLYLGADLPLDQLQGVVERSGCKAVVLASRAEVEEDTEMQLAEMSSSLSVPLCLGGLGSDKELPLFEQAGGIRLGSRIAIALRVVATHVPVLSAQQETKRSTRD